MMAEKVDERVSMAVKVDPVTHRRIKIHCAKTGASVKDFVLAALEEKLARVEDR